MIDFIKHPDELFTRLRDDVSISGKHFGRVISHFRSDVGVFPDVRDHKTVAVGDLKQGDTFVLNDFGEEVPYVYIVTAVFDHCVDVTCLTGGVFTLGSKFEVIPVNLSCAVKIAEV